MLESLAQPDPQSEGASGRKGESRREGCMGAGELLCGFGGGPHTGPESSPCSGRTIGLFALPDPGGPLPWVPWAPLLANGPGCPSPTPHCPSINPATEPILTLAEGNYKPEVSQLWGRGNLTRDTPRFRRVDSGRRLLGWAGWGQTHPSHFVQTWSSRGLLRRDQEPQHGHPSRIRS